MRQLFILQKLENMFKKLFVAMLCVLPVCAMAQEFGSINRNEIFQAMPETKEAIQTLDKLAKNSEDELLLMREEYQKKGNDFMAQRDSLPESILQRRMAEIQDLETRMQDFYTQSQTNIQKKQQELIIPINKKLSDAIKAVGDELGLIYIIDTSAESACVYVNAAKTKDVTNEVRKKLGIL